MSDHADSERTRNCTRLLYIAIRKMPNKTTTATTAKTMWTLLNAGIQGDVSTERPRFQSFKVSKFQGCNGGNQLLPFTVVFTVVERSIRGGRGLADLFCGEGSRWSGSARPD